MKDAVGSGSLRWFALSRVLTDELRGSIPLQATKYGLVVQLVRISACHAEGREFESRPDRHFKIETLVNQVFMRVF